MSSTSIIERLFLAKQSEGTLGKDEFRELYQANAKLVRSVIFQIAGESTLDDLVQETFIKIWRHHKTFAGEAKLSSWVYRIAVNTALDYLRTSASRQELARDAQTAPDDLPAASSADGSDPWRSRLLKEALAELSPEHRVVLVLAYLQDLTVSEIAAILQVAEGTVKSRLFHARQELRQELLKRGVTSD